MRIPEAVLGMTVTGNYPTTDTAYLRAISATDRDMVLKADPATITMVPWAADPTAQALPRYMPAAMALAAPYVNSYRRLVRNTTAPINVQWGYDNRTVGFRAPEAAPHERHIENRVIGADANPYLAFAVTLACGYLGMTEKLKPWPPAVGSAQALDFELPQGLPEALRLLRAEEKLHAVLGERFVDAYAAIKDQEHLEFMRVISPWEREHLLLHV